MKRQTPETSLVPFIERVRTLQACRALLAILVTTAAALFPNLYDVPLLTIAMACGGYFAVTALTLLAARARRKFAVTMFSTALLADGVFIAASTCATIGFATPLIGLMLMHLVAVTLLASFRTGLKIAAWHTLLMMSTNQLQQSGVLSQQPSDPLLIAIAVAALWIATLTTAGFASVNERELRRRNYDLAALARLSLRLEGSLMPQDVAASLVSAVCDDQEVERAVLLVAVDDRLERLGGRDDVPEVAGNAADDDVICAAVASHRTLRVPRLDPDRDPWLVAALPNAQNVILVPFYADNAIAGILVAEHGSRRGSRVERRVLSMLERYTSHAALALNNARLLAQVRELADSDGLTGVANRRTFDRTFEQNLTFSALHGLPLSIVLVDIDHFKSVNDTYGHQVGDITLREVARALLAECRQTDLVARYGGEEFAIVLPNANAEGAAAFAERLRLAVADALEHPRVTASFGVATSLDGSASGESLVALADAALYRSKQEGRNRVTVSLAEPAVPAQGDDGAPADTRLDEAAI